MDFEAVIRDTFGQFVGRNACYYAIAAIGLNIQFGYTGLLNFGQAAFMAAGAYGLDAGSCARLLPLVLPPEVHARESRPAPAAHRRRAAPAVHASGHRR